VWQEALRVQQLVLKGKLARILWIPHNHFFPKQHSKDLSATSRNMKIQRYLRKDIICAETLFKLHLWSVSTRSISFSCHNLLTVLFCYYKKTQQIKIKLSLAWRLDRVSQSIVHILQFVFTVKIFSINTRRSAPHSSFALTILKFFDHRLSRCFGKFYMHDDKKFHNVKKID